MNKEFFDAVSALSAEKGIPESYIYEKVEMALVVAAKHDFNGRDIVHCEIDPEKQKIKLYATKNVVEEVVDPDTELTLEQAQLIRKSAKIGKTIDIPLKMKDFSRVIAMTAKHVIRQGIREGEKGVIIEEFKSKTQEIITGKVERIDPVSGNVVLSIGKNNAVLTKLEQIPNEKFKEGENVKVYLVDVQEDSLGRSPRIVLSRTHPGMVRRLFEQEIPEIYDGTIEIRGLSREAGLRTKIAVSSNNENVEPVGACIGPRGRRIDNIVSSIGGEKIDVVKYSDDIGEYIASSLSPAKVCSVEVLDEEAKMSRVTVPDNQLSLAIGNKGQNVRLAAKLTGWKIDIKPESGFFEGHDKAE